MAKRGAKPKGKVKVEWSPDLAYAIGLLAADGSLSSNGRHIAFVSKDIEQLNNFMAALDFRVATGSVRAADGRVCAYRVQFGDVLFYKFLLSIGLTPNKSKTIGEIKVPTEYFFDFLRGSFDGDGCTYSYFDPRWKSSFMFYTTFVSASPAHILWLQREIADRLGFRGHITGDGKRTVLQLKYAKADSLILLRKMYQDTSVRCLARKRLKIEKMLRTIGQRL